MDEPLSNLDAKLRVDMRSELKRLHTETGTTMIYVTHDQVEALTMSTKIAIFREGIIIQVAHPLELYNNPANLYVADFIGNPRINFVDGKAEVSASGLTVNSVLGRMTFPADHLKDENMPRKHRLMQCSAFVRSRLPSTPRVSPRPTSKRISTPRCLPVPRLWSPSRSAA